MSNLAWSNLKSSGAVTVTFGEYDPLLVRYALRRSGVNVKSEAMIGSTLSSLCRADPAGASPELADRAEMNRPERSNHSSGTTYDTLSEVTDRVFWRIGHK